MQDGLQTDVSTVSGVIAESEDEEDSSDVPHSLGLSINLSVLSNPPTFASATLIHTHRVDPFRQHFGPTHILPSTAKAIVFFGQVFDDDLFRHIVDHTNLYALQNPPSSSCYRWFHTSIEELKAFIGVQDFNGFEC